MIAFEVFRWADGSLHVNGWIMWPLVVGLILTLVVAVLVALEVL